MSEKRGILNVCDLPNIGFDDLWERIVVPTGTKERLIAQVLLSFTVRKKISFGALPLHGLILLIGPPGTGKTSLAKGVASKAAGLLKGTRPRFLQVEPHELTSSALGRSQREMYAFFNTTVVEYLAQGSLIVLLDEVETMAVDRRQLSLDANPIDVHRATDAILASLDYLAEQNPDLLFIATSNFPQALDSAFVSRADFVEYIEKPDAEACAAILSDTFVTMAEQWPRIASLTRHSKFKDAVKKAVGLDGRQIRKAVLNACTTTKDVAINPDLLKIEHVIAALVHSKRNSE